MRGYGLHEYLRQMDEDEARMEEQCLNHLEQHGVQVSADDVDWECDECPYRESCPLEGRS